MEVDVHDELGRFRVVRLAAIALLVLLAPVRALALTIDVTHSGPSLVGEPHAFVATPAEAVGNVTYEWRFGDAGDFVMGGAEMSFAFEAPGLYFVDVLATDESGASTSAFLQHLVHYPLTPARPTSATSIIFDAARNRVYSLNQDNDTVTVIDSEALAKVAEVAVYEKPESLALTPAGKIWVAHQDDYAVAVIDPETLLVERGFRLPYASQPVGIAVSPSGDAAYVSLMALGKLLKLDPVTGDVIGEVAVGPSPRGIAVSYDGKDVYVSRFISPDAGGEVVKVDASTMTVVTRIVLPIDTTTADGDQAARGLPNYLFSVALTPDGRQAWVPGKKDNILRGRLRDGLELTHDTTVRPLACVIDTLAAAEIPENRVDLDDRSMPVHVEFTPYGNFAILALAGSNRLEVRDVNRPTQVYSAIADVGLFPRASVLAPNGRLFVQSAHSREVRVYDLSSLVDDFDQATPPELAVISAVLTEKLSPEVLLGKKIFHNAEDTRMAFEGYISCGGCHFEGIEDGRVYDFSTRGEGLRNTVSLLGRRGNGQGRMNWSGNLDEVQDFEHQIRDLFKGLGFLPDDVFATHGEPLGDPKTGLSADLDALSAYVTSLDRVNPSPYKNPDGTLTPDGERGKAHYDKLGCNICHGGPDFTDSSRGSLHDVGTITEASGLRAGSPLFGIDTPTLLGVWETPPYLHDGSAPTLRDVLTTKNPGDLHGYVSVLSSQELDELVSYVLQIDGDPPIRLLPFDPPAPPGSGGAAGNGGQAASGGGAGDAGGCVCTVSGGRSSRGGGASWLALLVGVVLSSVLRRRGFAQSRAAMAAAALALFVLATGCSSEKPDDGAPAEPSDWSILPEVTQPDPELAAFDSRQGSIERICARGRGDPFAQALCGRGRRPEIRSLVELLDLVGLGEERAFALTANSTSLVARAVSALNPRIIVFPRVDTNLTKPETMTAVGFVRGETFVELVSRDGATGELNFYLVAFERRCSYESAGCDLASLLSEEIEHDWTAYSVYDHVDLESTSFDCLSCHRPGGQGTPHILRMQELESPWLHWFPQRFGQRTESDRVLLAEFSETHGVDQQYGGIPIATITSALDEGSGAQLELFVRAEGFSAQPNPFDAQISAEMKSGSSPTWEARFQAHLRGEAIAVPYPAIDVTDEAKRAAAGRSYQDVVRGVAPRETLLDVRDVFSADATEKLSFVPAPGADGRGVLLQMCARCHDGRGNPEHAKNLFNVVLLDQMMRVQKDLAISRLSAPGAARMPPWRSGSLTPEHIEAATLELLK